MRRRDRPRRPRARPVRRGRGARCRGASRTSGAAPARAARPRRGRRRRGSAAASRLRWVATPPNWRARSTRTTSIGPLRGGGDGDVGRDGRRPDAALRAEDGDRPPRPVIVTPSAEMTGARSRERWKRSSSASTRASSSRASNGRAMTSSAPASRKRIRSSTSSVVADAHDRDRRQRPASPGSRGRCRPPTAAPADDVDDHQLVARRPGRTPRRGRPSIGDGVAGAGQDRRDRLAGARVGLEEQDGAGGHGASQHGRIGRA